MAGRGASLFAFLLLVVNVFLQGSFAFYLIDGLDEKPLTNNDVDELKWWRRHVAHSLESYNEAKGESLARRVCNEDYGVEVSGVQLGLHAMLNDYLGDYFKRHRDGVFNIGIGPGGYVCMLAICLWVITVCIDARRAFDTVAALHNLPRSSKSDIRVDGTSRIVIRQISYARLVACVLVHEWDRAGGGR